MSPPTSLVPESDELSPILSSVGRVGVLHGVRIMVTQGRLASRLDGETTGVVHGMTVGRNTESMVVEREWVEPHLPLGSRVGVEVGSIRRFRTRTIVNRVVTGIRCQWKGSTAIRSLSEEDGHQKGRMFHPY